MSDSDKFPPNESDKTVNINTGDLNINANVNGDVNLTIKKPRPKPIPIEGAITPNHKRIFKDLIDKIVDLGIRTNKYKDHRDGQPKVRNALHRKLDVSRTDDIKDEFFNEGECYLQKWLFSLLTNDEVISKPPEWWRDYLLGGIHINKERNGVSDETYRDYLKEHYYKDSAEELSNDQLADVFNHSKNGRFIASKRLHYSVNDLRLRALIRYFDEKEQAGDFDRMNIRITKKEMFSELQNRDRSLFAMASSTFDDFLTKAKKIMPFHSNPGARPKKDR